jgi:non-reducing end alpha-L-arabinofuranosidase
LAAGSLPCDIYAAGGTPCVAAHSTVRALFSAYNGSLYQVRRASDNATLNIGVLSPGGYANATAQDSFCAGTSCVITIIYDQSGRGNNLTQAPPGGFSGPAGGGYDNLANATAAPVTLDGHEAYGVYIAPGTGYRNDNTNGIATGDDPEGEYAVFDGTHYNGRCCFDYGNAETDAHDDGNGTMEAIYFGNAAGQAGAGSGPWVMTDQENGLFSGFNVGYNSGDQSTSSRFVTAMAKGGPNLWAIKAANAQSGGLTTMYSGARPNASGYNPMHKQGAIILGIGGDNSNWGAGTFYEGVMTSGYPADATDDAVQTSIVAAGYGYGARGAIHAPGGKCVDVQSANPNDGTPVQLYDCNGTNAQVWTVAANGTLQALGKCLDIIGDGTAAGTKVEIWDCNGVGGQQWVPQPNGTLFNPQSGDCLDDPGGNTANGTQLQIWTCNNLWPQVYQLPEYPLRGAVSAPGGKCVDDAGASPNDGAHVQLWDCNGTVAQTWTVEPDGTLQVLGKCLDIDGDGTAAGTKVEIWDCNGVGGQQWVPQANGSLLNPQSGDCLDDPGGNTADGTQLQIWTCNNLWPQVYLIP